MINSSDTVLGQTSTYGYDAFNRLATRTVTAGTGPNLSWVYDRWGNRWQQNVTGGSGSAPQPQYSFNTGDNQITTSGYAYDAAGNLTSDSVHAYTYDAEGNIVAVDGGATATYTYDALNHRVQTVTSTGTTDFVFNASGQRVSIWSGGAGAQTQGQYYWGSEPVAYYKSGETHFQHQDWMGTERLRTLYNGSVEGEFASLPFGDAQATVSGADTDAYHYAMLDYDYESSTDHAQYRQYGSTQGQWMSPDPYSGSYDPSNPQSFDRYAYALNMPVSAAASSGLFVQACVPATAFIPESGDCDWGVDDGSEEDGGPIGLDGYSLGEDEQFTELGWTLFGNFHPPTMYWVDSYISLCLGCIG